MSETSSVTQCPHCKTAFHIGLAQLDAAGGRVRCGSCLEIFNAKEHFVVEQTHLFDDKNHTEEPTPENQDAQDLQDGNGHIDQGGGEEDVSDEEGPIILGNYDPTAAVSISRKDVQQAAQAESETAPEDKSDTGSSIIADLDGPVVELDDPLDEEEREALLQDALASVGELDDDDTVEEWDALDNSNFLETTMTSRKGKERKRSDDSILIDDETPLDILQAEISDSAEPVADRNPVDLNKDTDQARQWEDVDVDEEIAPETPIYADTEASVSAETPESESESESESETEPEREQEQETEPESESEAAEAAEAETFAELTELEELADEQHPEEDVSDEEPAATADEAEADQEASEPETESTVEAEENADDSDLEDQPSPDFFIDTKTQRKGRFAKSHWGWNVAAAGLVVVLIGELLFLQPTFLSKQPWFQSFSQALCGALPCNAEPYLDIEQIGMRTHMSSNTDLNNVLTAYVELRNEAEVAQAFPKIAVYFSDFRGRTTASRAFTPDEYLRGEARSLGVIPTDRPVVIEIDFLDPGESSTSHVFRLLP